MQSLIRIFNKDIQGASAHTTISYGTILHACAWYDYTTCELVMLANLRTWNAISFEPIIQCMIGIMPWLVCNIGQAAAPSNLACRYVHGMHPQIIGKPVGTKTVTST